MVPRGGLALALGGRPIDLSALTTPSGGLCVVMSATADGAAGACSAMATDRTLLGGLAVVAAAGAAALDSSVKGHWLPLMT